MYKIVLATNNKNKIVEFSSLLADLPVEVISLGDIGFEGDIEEDGTTFEENSLIKSCTAAAKGYIGIADDSGLCVDFLDGGPGIYSARYAGEPCTYADNNNKLMKVMENTENRGAEFVCCMSLVVPDSLGIEIPAELLADESLQKFANERAGVPVKAVTVRGTARGMILRETHGDGGFGYDPLFYVPEFGKTYSELSKEEKNKISHRGNASRMMTAVIEAVFTK